MKIFTKSIILFISLMLFGCQTIKNKSDEVAEKENEKFGKFVGQKVINLKNEIGAPNEDYVNEQGNEVIVYKTKKYGIPCERKFTINSKAEVIGFSSSGCI